MKIDPRKLIKLSVCQIIIWLLAACSLEPADYPTPTEPTADSDRLIIL